MQQYKPNKLNAQIIKSKSDKLQKKALRNARKQVKKGQVIDSHSLALYLQAIDDKYIHLKTSINNSTLIVDYEKVRTDKVAETRQLLDFFNQDYYELDRLAQIVEKKAEQAERIDDFKHQRLTRINLNELQKEFETITQERIENGKK